MGAVHLGDDGAYFLGGEDGGEVSRLSGMNGVNVGEFYFEDMSVEKEDCAEGLFLGGCGDFLFYG